MAQDQLSFQQKSLVQQGYRDLDAGQLAQIDWGLRFTPVVCSLMTLVGLYTENPRLLSLVSFLGIWAYFAPSAHPMDLLYNHVVRHIFGAAALPPNPFQRRLACFAAGVMNAGAATLFVLDLPLYAKIVGGVLLVLQMVVITTHFCALSWVYDIVAKMVGTWEGPIDLAEARALLSGGATLVDVRESNEFAQGHLDGAVNFPLSSLNRDFRELNGKVCLLYCASGMRSRMAAKQLKQSGCHEVYNLGSLSRGSELQGE